MQRRGRAGGGPVNAFATRLIAIAAGFGLAVLVQHRESSPISQQQLDVLYALVLVGFLLALAFGVLAVYGRRGPWLLAGELVSDGALITGLVYSSGGSGSFLGFLYIVWIVSTSIRASSSASAWVAAGAIVSYGAVALGTASGWLPTFAGVSPPPFDEASTAFGVHTAAFLTIALLARRLQREVEERRHELYELGELHQRIVDNVSSGLLTVDRSERVTSFNREAERITGHAASQVLGWPLDKLLPTLGSVVANDADWNESGRRIELPFRPEDGEPLHLGVSRSVLRDAAGRPDGAILIFQDLTRVREMEEQLRRSERLSVVGQLATGLAHEVRNPLASLSGAIELLGTDLQATDPSSRRLLRIVERETGRLDRLVSDFLAYAAGRPPRREAVALADLVTEIQELLASGEHGRLELAVEIEPGLTALGDADQLRQVLWNLILNAAQASPPDGRVVVRGSAVPQGAGQPEQVRIEVEDRGAGIPPEELERAFEPFFTTKAKGTGLGLATVHRVIEAHGGGVALRSDVGKGTVVSVTLEAAQAGA